MTKSRCSRTDLIWTPNYFGQTFGLRTHARPDLRRVCVSARDVFASLVTGRCSVSVGDVSASLLRMSTSQSGTFQRLNYVMNRTYSLSYLHLLVTSSWKDAFTSGTHLRLGPDWSLTESGINGSCHPGRYCLGHYPGTLSHNQVTATRWQSVTWWNLPQHDLQKRCDNWS